MSQPISFDVQRLIGEIAARHRFYSNRTTPHSQFVTMNRLVLEESLEVLHSRVLEDLALFHTTAQKTQNRAEFPRSHDRGPIDRCSRAGAGEMKQIATLIAFRFSINV
ncbi:MAG: hypothetical protein ACR2JB_05635 [Bryobacteraceae bacterium]